MTVDRCGSSPEKVMEFIRQYFSVSSGDIATVTAYEQQAYADQVMYYGKLLTRSDVVKDKGYYLRNWPVRSSNLQGSPELFCNPASLTYDFTGRVYWSTYRPGALISSGLTMLSLGIRVQSSGNLKIASESSTIVERYPDKNP